jgi:fused signal recognition particle receptor
VRKRFSKLLDGLSKTRRAIAGGIREALGRGGGLSGDVLEGIEEALIASDVGVDTSLHLIEALRGGGPLGADPASEVSEVLAREIEAILLEAERPAPPEDGGPHTTLVVGVNGVGKTTTIGKLARRRTRDGQVVVLAAADTFRAAAREQLAIWAERSGSHFVGGQEGGDPAAVAYDALEAARARGADALIVDTAGRLHTQRNLLEELRKIRRVLGRALPGAPHETLLVLDANTGQNALSQARLFDEALDLTGVALAKLDGTARGGIVVAIARELRLPVRYVGVGEGIDDLEVFDPALFARALVGAAGEGGDGGKPRAGIASGEDP